MQSEQLGGVIGFKKKAKTQKNCKTAECTKAHILKEFSIKCFKNFLKHSNVQFLGKGTYGKAFLLVIKDTSYSPYLDISGRPVKVLLVKVGFIAKNTDDKRSDNNTIAMTTVDDFKKESQTQEFIFRNSLKKYNSALCPAIVYLDIITTKQCKEMYPKLYNKIEQNEVQNFSLIGMETFEHVDNLYKYGMTKDLEDTVFFMLMRLAAIGFAHGDPGPRNIIIDKEIGRPFLIDFGNVQKLTLQETQFMQTQLKKITDLRRVMHILLKGFPQAHPNLPNWDWLKYIKNVRPLRPNEIDSMKDSNWKKIL